MARGNFFHTIDPPPPLSYNLITNSLKQQHGPSRDFGNLFEVPVCGHTRINAGAMEKNYFTTLRTGLKTELTWNYGELITTVETPDIYISLFLLDKFFVEIHVNKQSNELLEVVIQDDTDVLYEYVRDIDLDHLAA